MNKRNLTMLHFDTSVDQRGEFNIEDKGNDGCAFKCMDENILCSYKTEPAAAIIAALSVHKAMGGMCKVCFSCSKRFSNAVRNPLFAATPPATMTSFTSYS